MKRNVCGSVLFLLGIFVITGLGIGATGSSFDKYCDGFVSGAVESPVRIDVDQTNRIVNLNVNVSGTEMQTVDNHTVWRIPNEGIEGRENYPDLPVITRFVRVPDRGRIVLSYQLNGEQRIAAPPPAEFYLSDEDGNSSPSRDSNPAYDNGIYPTEPVVISDPAIMRGVRIVTLSFYPIRWDADSQEYISVQNFQAEISALPGQGRNEIQEINRCASKGFDRMLEALLVNPPRRDNPEYPPGGYLVVADEEAPEAVQEFVEWKRRAGHHVELLSIRAQEMDHNMLRGFIREIYFEIGFEYLVLMGSDDGEPPTYMPMDQENRDGYYDVFYGLLEGDDEFPEVGVGTFNCITEESLICAIRRAISYQSAPYNDEPDWFTRAGVGVGACSVPDDLSPSYTGKWIEEVLNRNQFDDIATSFFSDNEIDSPHPMVEDLYNRNTNFIIVRAHLWNLDVNNINPGPVYPFQFLVSSGTISPPDRGAFNEVFRQGTPDNMKGPSAGFGHYSSPRTNNANALVGGLVESLFLLDIDTYGWARNYAVTNLFRVLGDGADHIEYCFSHWRYYGDPGQWCWVGVPQEVEVFHRQEIDPDATEFSVRVTNQGGEPVPNATVCINQDEGLQLITKTNENGQANFTWQVGLLNESPLQVTVTGDGIYPNQGEIEIVNSEIWISLINSIVDDGEGGNGDGIVNPGENINLSLVLMNTAEERSPALAHITVESLSPWAIVEGVDFNADPLEPEAIIQLENPIPVEILQGCPNDDVIQLRVSIDVGDQFPVINAGVELAVTAPDLGFVERDGEVVIEIDGNLFPGMRSNLSIPVRNNGNLATPGLDARLETLSNVVMVTAFESHYPEIGEFGEGLPDGPDFTIATAPSTVPGSVAEFRLILSGGPVQDTLLFDLTIGEIDQGEPLSPDNYGYIALDVGDQNVFWGEAPVYDWIELNPADDPDFEGVQLEIEMGEEEDTSVLIELPMNFRYYGEDFNQITVCSNGWIAVGDQTNLLNQQNWVMPGFDGAFGMMAVFWDRLVWDGGNDGLFSYYDDANGRFIIEWITGVENDRDRADNRFEIILYDVDRFPSLTGDSQFLFQYHTVNNVQDQWEANAFATVGISSPDGKDGLLYSYWDVEPESCPTLDGEDAILWTTVNYADIVRIHGRVTRWIDANPVAGATVATSNGFETISQEDGSFVIFGLFPEPFDITSTARDYSDLVIEDVVVEAGEEFEQDILQPHVWLESEQDTLRYGFEIERDQQLTLNATGEGICEYSISVVYDGEITAEDFWLPEEPIEGNLVAGNSVSIDLVLEGPGREIEIGEYFIELLIAHTTPQEDILIPIEITVSEDVENPNRGLPTTFKMYDPFPNPFNAKTTLGYALPINSVVTFTICDITGRMVSQVITGNYAAGEHEFVFDANELSTGFYFIRMETENFIAMRRVLLLR